MQVTLELAEFEDLRDAYAKSAAECFRLSTLVESMTKYGCKASIDSDRVTAASDNRATAAAPDVQASGAQVNKPEPELQVQSVDVRYFYERKE